MQTIEAILLGTAQDGGVPQAGCRCDRCLHALHNPAQRKYVTCLALVDHATQRYWLIDATPDFREQLGALQERFPGYTLAGILLTHAHIGHYTGLMHLGREAMGASDVPVYASQRMADFLRDNAPWSQLVSLSNIELRVIVPEQEIALTPNLQVTPIHVPHRGEWSDTLAFIVCGCQKQLFYCPDIDAWDLWDRDVRTFLDTVDIALLDATFYSPDELPGRDLREIPHPLAVETAKRLANVNCQVFLIHLNHTNPLHEPRAEREKLSALGIGVGDFGMSWDL